MAAINSIATQAQQFAESADAKGLYRTVRLLAPNKTAAAPGLRLETGELAHTSIDKAKRWQRHFRDFLEDTNTDFPNVLKQVACVNAKAFQRVRTTGHSLASIPSFRDVCSMMAFCTEDRTHGEDAVPA